LCKNAKTMNATKLIWEEDLEASSEKYDIYGA